MSGFLEQLRNKAAEAPPTIVFPESNEEKILVVVRKVLDLHIGYPILVGDADAISKQASQYGVSLDGIKIVSHKDTEKIESMVQQFLSANSDFSANYLKRMLRDPQNFAAMMVKCGEADCMASGVCHTTGEVILCSQMIIGLQEGVSTVSSIGILDVPGFEGSQGNLIAIADCAVCADPTPEERADIAISSADTVKSLLGWEPRVALLSFSTKGSAEHKRIDEILETLKIVRERRPDIKIDGELQLDAAIAPEVAAKKVHSESDVAGKANILIFPDLGAGNIGVKLVQRFAKAVAYGPFLQGFAKPVTDFSRSAPIEEMIGAITMVAVRAQKRKG